MVDIVTQTMPAKESDVHAARNFLSKILRNSMRKNNFKGNESSCRPHSWQKTNPDETAPEETQEHQPAWQTRYDPGSPSNRLTGCWGQGNPRPLSSQFSSYMEKSEPVSQTFSKEESLLSKNNKALGPGETDRDTAKHELMNTSTDQGFQGFFPSDGVFYRGVPTDCHRYLTIPTSSGGRVSPSIYDQSNPKFSPLNKSNHRPVWHIPENKTSKSQTPAAPAPPLRNDSFTATRAHEKGMLNLSEDGCMYSPQKTHFRVVGSESRTKQNQPPKHFLQLPGSLQDFQNGLNPTKPFSNSNTDISEGKNPFSCEFQHQRQHSDESPFSVYPNSSAKSQSVGNYYRSFQDLQTNASNRSQSRTSTACDSNHEAHFRYYCITAQNPFTQMWMGEDPNTEMGHNNRAQTSGKNKNQQSYLSLPSNIGSDGYSKPPTQSDSPARNKPVSKSSLGKKEALKTKNGVKPSRDISNHQDEQMNTISNLQLENPWIKKQDLKISPNETPLLHSLVQESQKMVEKTTLANTSSEESIDVNSGKLVRRTDRYATTLRKEIQQKRAQLQKSRSAATLTASNDAAEDCDVWKSNETSTSSSDGSFSSTYKDHLKDAQEKVLKATSFMRRDLEIHGNEPPKKTGNGPITRIGGRKRFAMDKKIHSFSEPDKMNEVGVETKSSRSFMERYNFFEGSNQKNPQAKVSQDFLRQSKSSHCELYIEEQNRLGTFAEYEASWSMQKTPVERRSTSRYRSAENILDSALEESDGPACIHERSRSSPSADFWAQAHNLEQVASERKVSETQKVFRNEHQKMDSSSLEIRTSDPTFAYPSIYQHELTDSSARKTPSAPHLHLIPQRLKNEESVSEDQKLSCRNKLDESAKPISPGGNVSGEKICAIYSLERDNQNLELRESTEETKTFQGKKPEPSEKDRSSCTSFTDQNSHQSIERTTKKLKIQNEKKIEIQDQRKTTGIQHHRKMMEMQKTMMDIQEQTTMMAIQDQKTMMKIQDQKISKIQDQKTITEIQDKKTMVEVQDQRKMLEVQDLENILEIQDQKKILEIQDQNKRLEIQDQKRLVNSQDQWKIMEIQDQKKMTDVQDQRLMKITDKKKLTGIPDQKKMVEIEDQKVTGVLNQRKMMEIQDQKKMTEVQDQRLTKITDQTKLTGIQDQKKMMEIENQKMMEVQNQVTMMEIQVPRKMKTTMDLMEGIFPEMSEEDQQRRKSVSRGTSSKNTEHRSEESACSSGSLEGSSSYFSTSAAKAELLIKMKDMQEHPQLSEEHIDHDLSSKKQELMWSLSRKLQVLREARESLQDDIQQNDALGEDLEAFVKSVCEPKHVEKFQMFVGDLERVIILLLSLSGRLARHTLMEKRRLLIGQHEDARELKENLDRRERAVHEILLGCLSQEQLADYTHFVKMKSALIIEQRKLEDKIKLGEEQLRGLRESLPLPNALLY
ncbi:hypothetical protein DNTS_018862 [Danionella cerebrum]|uniref:ASD2 domain-containing protein n=1 Tax=Danionella cerebrum TaxID=2873325 RepID=A0A553QES3_9TELE|nr:hypothetical protein DNTS_018862 [Danionella translucida]